MTTAQTLRLLLLVEGIAFALASGVHSGAFIEVSVDPGANIAEGVIALVLLAGAAISWLRPAWTRPVAIAAQAFGLLGSLIGLYLAVIGLGPNTLPDIVFHVVIVLMLALGIVAAFRAPGGDVAAHTV